MKNLLVVPIIVLSMVFATCQLAHSAEISFQESEVELYSAIVIDGPIVEGDFEKFLLAVIEAGTDPGRVFISSPGGSVSEAIKIGVLVRELGFQAQVPRYMGTDHPPYCFKYDVEDCICVSACFLTFVGGVSRDGGAIRVHRSFLDHELLRKMSIAEAADYSNALSTQVRNYLQHMSSPDSLNQIMESIPSNESRQLDTDFVFDHLWGPAVNVEEWLIARCGNPETALTDVSRSIGRDDHEIHEKTFSQRLDCSRKAFQQERRRVFFDAIEEAFSLIDDERSPDALLDYRGIVSRFDIQDFLGERPNEWTTAFTFLGHGARAATQMTEYLTANNTIYTDRNMVVGLGDDGRVNFVDVNYFDVNDRPMYQGKLLNGLSSTSSGREYFASLGAPIGGRKIRHQNGGADYLMFQTAKSDIEVTFDPELTAPRGVKIYNRGYFQNSSFHSQYLRSTD